MAPLQFFTIIPHETNVLRALELSQLLAARPRLLSRATVVGLGHEYAAHRVAFSLKSL